MPEHTRQASRWVAHGIRHAGRMVIAALACGLSVPAMAAVGSGHTITPSDISSIRVVGSARIAPNGQQVIYSIREPGNGDAPGPTSLWRVATHGHSPPRRFGQAGDHEVRWSPDGTRVAFLRGGHPPTSEAPAGAGPANVWITNADGTDAHRLGRLKASVSTLRWSPDGSHIAAIATPLTKTSSPGVAVVADQPTALSRLYLIDTQDGTARAVTEPDVAALDVAWSPDGRKLAVRLADGPGLEYYWYQSRIEVLDLEGHSLATLPKRATAVHPRFSPDGRRVLYGRFNEPHGFTASLAIYDIDSGHAHDLGVGWKGNLGLLRWQADGRSLVGMAHQHTASIWVRVNARDGSVVRTGTIKGRAHHFTRADDGRVAFVVATRTRPGEVWLKHDQRSRALTDSNPQVAGWRLGSVRTVTWKSSRDGTPLHGLLVLPSDAPAGKPLKLVVQIHGGPYSAWLDGWLGSWHDWAQMLASHGFAVFMPNPRGSSGQGRAFAEATRNDWGGIDYQDILDGVDMLVERGIADPQRMAIAGWSYGGFMAAWAAGHNPDHRFKTAIVGAGITHLFTDALNTDIGYSYLPAYFGDPIRHHERYWAHSPVSYAHAVDIPVLILHGQDDQRVPLAQGKLLYHALKADGATVQMVTYPGAPHWFGGSVGKQVEADVQTRVLAWLQTWLGR